MFAFRSVPAVSKIVSKTQRPAAKLRRQLTEKFNFHLFTEKQKEKKNKQIELFYTIPFVGAGAWASIQGFPGVVIDV